MKWLNLLHFYQPYNQQSDILNRIVAECYLPLVRGLLDRSGFKMIVNISGSLTELLADKGYVEVLEGLRDLAQRGQIEFTESAMYHAFLPLLSEYEIERQIMLNNAKNKEVFGDVYAPTGVFSPEMAVNDRVINIVAKLGYKWVAVSETAIEGGAVAKGIYVEKKSGLIAFPRNKRVSSLILSGVVRTAGDLLQETADLEGTDDYWFTVMDAETFGHHRIGHEKFLFELADAGSLKTMTVSDFIAESFGGVTLPQGDTLPEVSPHPRCHLTPGVTLPMGVTSISSIRASTWTNEEQDFWLDKEKTVRTEGRSFILWKDPENPIHTLQWEFVNFVLEELAKAGQKNADKFIQARLLADKAFASDQFWWASAKPWWSLEMVEQGAFSLQEVILTLEPEAEAVNKAQNYYRQILDQAFEWQRTGYIRTKHLENSATYMKQPLKERCPDEWYNQLMLEFEDEMNKCATKHDFERAIKWRDALYKIKNGSDIFDVLHVVNELWTARKIPELKPFLEYEWGEFSPFSKGNFKGVHSKKDFDRWKASKKS